MQSDSRRRRIRLIKSVEQRNQPSRHSKQPNIEKNGSFGESAATLARRLFVECGGDSAIQLVIERDGHPKQMFTMDRPYRIIGSDESCDIHLVDEEIPLRHSVVHWIDGQLFYCSISQQSTLFSGQNRDLLSGWLHEQPLQIGSYRISVSPSSSLTEPQPSPLDRSARLANEYPRLGFQFVGVEQSDALWPINRTLTLIGRGTQCKLRLNHKSVANVQAMLVRTATGCWLVDLANDGGTAVNDDTFEILPIDVGDTLRFGDFEVEIVTTDPPPISQPRPAEANQKRPSEIPLAAISVESRTDESAAEAIPIVEPELAPVGLRERPVEQQEQIEVEEVEALQVASELSCPPSVEIHDADEMASQIVETVGLNTHWSHTPIGVRIQPSTGSNAELGPDPIAVVSSPCEPIEIEDFQVVDQTFEPLVEPESLPTPLAIEEISITSQPSWLAEEEELPAPAAAELTMPVSLEETVLIADDIYDNESPIELLSIDAATSPELSAAPAFEDDIIVEEEAAAPELAELPTEPADQTPPAAPAPIIIDADLRTFVDSQKSRLLELKEQLLTLERVYNEESKYMVSRRMKQTLSTPVVETMKCYESIMVSLEQFLNPPPPEEAAETTTAEEPSLDGSPKDSVDTE